MTLTKLQGFYNSCVVAMFSGKPFPQARGVNERDMLNDFRTTMSQFHRTKWHEEARDIGLEYGLDTEALLAV
jgi:hypothetical protein